jgi:hypothetical protein
MVFWQTDVFVHVESYDMAERYLSSPYESDQFLIRRKGSRTRREAEDKWPLSSRCRGIDAPSDVEGRVSSHVVGCGPYDETHCGERSTEW